MIIPGKISPWHAERFQKLFDGRQDAFGVDRGGIVKKPVQRRHYLDHIRGEIGAAIGVFPLRDDHTVRFAAIDLDEPNFDLACDLADLYLPGVAWVERSRSGNAHVWVFFESDCPAWVARGQLRGALRAAQRPEVEVFPKQAELLPGMVGNYINLPYYGDERLMVHRSGDERQFEGAGGYTLDGFLDDAEENRIDPQHWLDLCRADGIQPPGQREDSEWGTRARPHRCATYMLEHAHDNPVRTGHRNVVFFSLAKMLLNCEQYDLAETIEIVQMYNEASPDEVPRRDVRHIVLNAEKGRFTSTGCDDPLMQPYADPDCEIANAR